MKKLAALILGLIAAQPAFAETPAAGSEQNPNEVVCRSVSVIGSRLARQRRCVTRAQWEQSDAADRDAARRGQQTQSNPQTMSAAERMRAAGRYNPFAGRGGTPTN